MVEIKVLDCTLRDGGYINNWDFGETNIQNIISLLNSAGTNYIETGFISSGQHKPSQSLYSNFQSIERIIPKGADKDKLFGMITYGEFPVNEIPDADTAPVRGIRLIFKKHQSSDALEYCRILKTLGYKLFINPTFIDQYKEDELLSLINSINDIRPYGMTIVDSMGVLKENDLLKLFELVDSNLEKSITLGFHSHNNLKLSFSNAQSLIETNKTRKLVIDSTLFGMGRGAGNICTELLTQYINDNYNGDYDLVPILKLVDEIINPIFKKNPWGYSVPYHLAAINHCHPNYAKYLIDKKTVPVDIINQILLSIPEDKKAVYDVDLIEQIYINKYLQHCSP